MTSPEYSGHLPSNACDICPLKEFDRELTAGESAFMFERMANQDSAMILDETKQSIIDCPVPVKKYRAFNARIRVDAAPNRAVLEAIMRCVVNQETDECQR